METIQDRLKLLMQHEGWNQKALAERMCASMQYVSKMLKKGMNPGQSFLDNLKKSAPEVSLDWLISGNGSMYAELNKQQIATPESQKCKDKDEDDCRRQLDIARAKLEMLQQCYDKLLDRVTPQHHTTQQQYNTEESKEPRGHDVARDRRIGTNSGH